MRRELLPLLCCPACGGELLLSTPDEGADITTGALVCNSCSSRYAIEQGIPRFVSGTQYASSFGLQWNRFRLEQIDAASGTTLSHDRFLAETGWPLESLAGSWVLDAGCGAGRFLAVAAESQAQVVGLDLSNAVDAAARTLVDHRNVHLVQARIDRPPFKRGAFDAAYCIGVIQHTDDPEASVRAVARSVRPGGRLAITAYERRRFTLLNAKYVARRLTRRLGDRTLLVLVFVLMPVLFPLTEILFRIPFLGRLFRFVIPVANYTGSRLSLRHRYRWALMDTYDMLAPRYDAPQRESDLRNWLGDEGVAVRRLPNPGVNVAGAKRVGSA